MSALTDLRVFSVSIAGTTLSLDTQPIVIILICVVIAIGIFLLRRTGGDRRIEIVVDIPLGGIGRVTFNPDREVARLAHQAWIELATRKAALPLDEENDVIEEVFNSWYELFRELRAIAKTVPATTLRTPNARLLIDTLVRALNYGLRPPLTRWHARFRVWYTTERAKRPGEDPQAIQRAFPQYSDMMADVRSVNRQLMQFASALHTIAQRAEKAAEEGDDSAKDQSQPEADAH